MCCPALIIGLLLSLLVILAGAFLLAYSKKESLGKFPKIASYVAILFGSAIFIGGLICALMMCGKCKGGSCSKDSGKCERTEMSNCHSGMMNNSHCEKGSGSCEKSKMMCHKEMSSKMHCSKNASENCCKEMNGKMECSKNETEKCCSTEEKIVVEKVIKK